ncbi:hypothetical protein E4634_08460 [Mangrovimicrobium sediminis]|uniref:Uncharacterized protein n=1 Tax=Mangrovimicrobium sediminis TaxID=2562682 RepID=A0A4Z0M3X1_9GAMM|nr:hypothetical protein [Haliea sp. SAOS-164]TGD74154.1 hypothetical protein E4634_08460 [Haliea sp. SAOS-164]
MAKHKTPYVGGWHNLTLSDRSLDVLRKVPGYTGDLETQISFKFGEYRMWGEFYASRPTSREKMALLADLAKYSKKMQECVALLPSDMEQNIAFWMNNLRGGDILEHLPSRYMEYLQDLEACCKTGVAELKNAPYDKAGGSREIERQLLSDVAELLESLPDMTLSRAAELAHEILMLNGIRTNSANPRRTVRKVRHQRGGQSQPEN